MNVIDWMRESARYMAKTKPDVYDYSSALNELSDHMEQLRKGSETINLVSCGGFALLRIVEDDGIEEFLLTRTLSSVTMFEPEEDCLVLGHVDDIDLPPPGLDQFDGEVDTDDEL